MGMMEAISDKLTTALQLHLAGELAQAEELYRQILAAHPNNADAWHYLGVLADDAGRSDEAIECIERSLNLRPEFAEAHFNLGAVFKGRGLLDKAARCFGRAIELQPSLAEAHRGLGIVLQTQGKHEEAETCFRRAIEIRPDFNAWFDLGRLFHLRSNVREAIECYRQVLAIVPEQVDAISNLADSLRKIGELDESIACCRRALALNPDYFEAHNNLGIALCEQGDLDEAATCFSRALGLQPDFAIAHSNLSMIMLARGDFDRGWLEYEWRWQTGEVPERTFDAARWTGEPLTGKSILLYAEQGLGDTIQFVRYAELLKDLGATVIVECQPAMLPLLKSCRGIDELVGQGDNLPGFDYQCPLLSLAGTLKTRLDAIPARAPYLFADQALAAAWRERLQTPRGYRIGINWHGREGHQEAARRDIPLKLFAGLAEGIPSMQFVCLQKGAGQEELNSFPAIQTFANLDLAHGAFMDTAAIMMNLDLVITSDTSVAHLPGALGVPVWVPLPYVSNWRWLLDRDDSPWYPTMRLFRQKRAGDWEEVFHRIRAELQFCGMVEPASARRGTARTP